MRAKFDRKSKIDEAVFQENYGNFTPTATSQKVLVWGFGYDLESIELDF